MEQQSADSSTTQTSANTIHSQPLHDTNISHLSSGYQSLPSNEDNSPSENMKLWKLRAVWFFLMLVIIQAIFGYLAKSVACLTATVLMISDYLGEHSIDRNRPNAFRRIECIIVLLCMGVLLAANTAFLIAAVDRIYVKEYSINQTFMLLSASLSLIASCIMLILHFTRDSVFQPRRFVQMSTFIGVRAQQIIHAIGNHGTCLVLFVAAIILYIQHDAILADSIATFVITVAVLSNAASVIPKHLYELRYIGTLEDTYEEVLSTGQEI